MTVSRLGARAQSGPVRRVGVLMNSTATDATWQSYLTAFVQGLRQLGWTEGQNLRIDTRWSVGDAALARIYAAQLIGLMGQCRARRPCFLFICVLWPACAFARLRGALVPA